MQPKDDGRRTPGPHASEGELHTFLDGALDLLDSERATELRAHLEACRHCRDQLAVESAVRDRAESLLGADDPLDTLVLPSLDELRARAGDPVGGPPVVANPAPAGGGDDAEAGRRGSNFGGNRWAWAATVVLSLGVGYGVGVVGSGGLRPGAPPMSSPPLRSTPALRSTPSPESVPESESEGTEDSRSESAPAERRQSTEEDAGSANMADGVPAQRSQADATDATAEPLAVSTVPPAAPAPVPAFGTAGGARAPSNASEAWIDARLADIPSDSTMQLGMKVDSLPTAARELRDRSIELASPRAARTSPLSLDELAATRLGAGDVAAPEAGGDADEEVELVLPGLTLDEVRWAEVWPGQEGVVASQRLPDGRLVELRVAGLPVGGDSGIVVPPEVREDAPSGWARAVRRVQGGWLVLDGPLPVERLAQLLALAG